MIIDITGTILLPGNLGADCPGNGTVRGAECCCDECDYLLCCTDPSWKERCSACTDADCPRSGE